MKSEFHSKLLQKLADVGEDRLNQAHERLLRIIVDADIILGAAVLSERALTQKEWDALSSAIDELILYAKMHFADEEDYLKTLGYPDIDQHQAAHHAIMETLNVNQEKIIQRDEAFLKDVRVWLLEWLFLHVNNKDYAYAQYFAKARV